VCGAERAIRRRIGLSVSPGTYHFTIVYPYVGLTEIVCLTPKQLRQRVGNFSSQAAEEVGKHASSVNKTRL
jgi:hypothetical protein